MTVFTELCGPNETGVIDMKYKILEQKYLELLENGMYQQMLIIFQIVIELMCKLLCKNSL